MPRKQHINNFFAGLLNDLDPNSSPNSSYFDAINAELTEETGYTALTNPAATTLMSNFGSFLGANDIPLAVFSCRAAYNNGTTTKSRTSLLVFTYRLVTSPITREINSIYLYDAHNDTMYALFDNQDLNIRQGDIIDCRIYGEANSYHAFWTDNKNVMRRIELFVNETGTTDYTLGNLLPLDNPDLIDAKRLFPVDPLTIIEVIPNGGGLDSGSYQFSYRYYNSERNFYSGWQLLTNPISIVQPVDSIGGSVTTTDVANDIYGTIPGKGTNKAIKLQIAKSHAHHTIFDSIQLAVIKNTTGSTQGAPLAYVLEPSTVLFGTASATSEFIYTGNETEIETVIDTVVLEDAGIETAKTLEIRGERAILGNIKYYDLDQTSVTFTNAETKVQELRAPTDPYEQPKGDTGHASGIVELGYYSALNCYNYRGYWREEVYRFGINHFNKYGNFAKTLVLDFSGYPYNPASPATFNKNWATSGTDWKFADRESNFGCILGIDGGYPGTVDDQRLRAYGLTIEGIQDHPSWSYGFIISRLPRKRSILGQSPIVNVVPFMGASTATKDVAEDIENDTEGYTPEPVFNKGAWDYGGGEDYFGPKKIAQGHTKGLVLLNWDWVDTVSGNLTTRFFYLAWRIQAEYNAPGVLTQWYHYPPNLLLMYPLEYMANLEGAEASGINLDGSEYVKVIDCVLTHVKYPYVNTDIHPGVDPAPTFASGALGEYVTLCKVTTPGAYYYFNTANADHTLRTKFTTGGGFSAIPPSPTNIQYGYYMDYADAEIILRDVHMDKERGQSINIYGNCYELADQQARVGNQHWYPGVMSPAFPAPNQRGLLLVEENDISQHIFDPTASTYNQNFHNLFSWNTAVDVRAVNSDAIGTDNNFASVTTAIADFSENKVVTEDTSIPFFIGNIDRQLGDDRYGEAEHSDDFIHTGVYVPLTSADVDLNTPKDVDVFGGDCFITRAIIKVNDNSQKKDSVYTELAPEPMKLDVTESTGSPGSILFVSKAANYVAYVELLDVWVESNVNGHYIDPAGRAYPFEFNPNDPNWERGVGYYNFPFRYAYNQGYSIENVNKFFASKALASRDLGRLPARWHYSNPKVINTSVEGFDVFSELDFEDMNESYGGITRIIGTHTDNLYIIQEDGIAQVYLGRITTSDSEGNLTNIKTGEFVGDKKYIFTGGGSQHLRSIQIGDDVIYLLDATHNQVLMIAGSLTNLSNSKVDAIIAGMFSDFENTAEDRVVGWFDDIKKRYGLYNNQTNEGTTYNARLKVWESRLVYDSDVEVMGIDNASQDTYALVRKVASGNAELYKMYQTGSRSLLFGAPITTTIDVAIVPEGDIAKIFDVCHIVATNPFTDVSEARVPTEDALPDIVATNVPIAKNRDNLYIVNELRDDTDSQRMRGVHLRLKIRISEDEKVSISRIITHYRESFRSRQ